MKLRREDITKISRLIVSHLTAAKLWELKVGEDKVVAKIEGIIGKNIDEEAAIEEEVKKLMDQYRDPISSGAIDPQKAYMMIKKQVAKERKFVL
jgi:hypothetical protein